MHNAWQILKDFGIISAIGAALIAYLVKQWRAVNALKMGVQALLRAQMIAEYNKWTERGYAPLYAKENFENCWTQYEALGKNGVMSGVHERFMDLPTERPKTPADEAESRKAFYAYRFDMTKGERNEQQVF